MAKTGCKVKIKWKGWKRGGYAEVMNGGGVQGMLDQKASAALSSANASFFPSPAREPGTKARRSTDRSLRDGSSTPRAPTRT